MNKIVLIGGGGHAGVLIDLINMSRSYQIAGILDPNIRPQSKRFGITVIGDDSLLLELYGKGIRNACVAVGSVKDNDKRKALYEKAKQAGFSVPFLVHTKSIIPVDLQISEGVQIMAGAIIQPNSFIGSNTIINTGSIIEHNCNIGSHVHVCPGAIISGGCTVHNEAFIGAGATVIHGITIGRNAVVAAGAVVVKDVPDNSIVSGIPAK
jgi:UDP-perosamine 4-acetyltransferase